MAAMSAAEAAAYASRRRIFFIAGHGMETPGTFQLSGECDVVVKKNTCEVAFETDFHRAMEGLLSLPEEMALHPIQYRNQITQRMGSVMVYSRNHPRINGMEGSCVKFIYHLMMMHFREDARSKYIEIHDDIGSGVIDLARWKAARTYFGPPRLLVVRERLPGMEPTAFCGTAENIEMIGDLYQHSIFPTRDVVETYLGIKWKENNAELYDMLADLRKQPFMNVTQELLCRHVAGVYYHMICRSMAPYVTPNIKEYVTQWQNWKKGNAPMNVRKIVSNPVVDRRFFRESKLRRNAYYRYYHSTPFQEKQYTTNMSNCRNLEASMASLEGLLHDVNATNATNAVKQKEKEKIQRRIRFLRTIRNEKHAHCVDREATQRAVQRAAQMEEAHQAALRAAQRTAHREAQRQVEEDAEETAQRSRSRRRSRSRSRSPTRHNGSQTHKKSQNRGKNRGKNRDKGNKE
jgi:hypothetical protein